MAAAPGSAAAAIEDCDAGQTRYKMGENQLENGQFEVGVCGVNTRITRVNVSYRKASGQGVQLRMGWEFVNQYGNASPTGWNWAGDAFTAVAGSYAERSWYGDLHRPNSPMDSPRFCVRGVLHDEVGGVVWTTRVSC